MTKKVTRADGIVTYVVEESLDSIVEEGDTVEDMPSWKDRNYSRRNCPQFSSDGKLRS